MCTHVETPVSVWLQIVSDENTKKIFNITEQLSTLCPAAPKLTGQPDMNKVGCLIIRKTCLCNEYPLKPHFYIVKLGYAGVYLSFLFLLQNINCGYSLERPCRVGKAVLMSTPTIYVLEQK